MNRGRISVLLLASLTASLAVAGANSPRSANKDEMITTARKAEENIQDVPIAIAAFSAEEMSRRSIRELEDVALATAGFSFEDYGGGFGVPVIRGGSQIRIQDLDQTTSVYLDGIYVPRQYAVDFGTVGFDRIEIVKGPQSALYGRNAFLGAVNYVSGGPGEELNTQVSGTIGSDERYDLSAEISGPIIDQKLGGRLLVAYSEFDGTWPNQNPNYDGRDYGKRGTTDNLGGWENRTIGVNLEAQPTEALSLEFDYYNVERFEETDPSVRVEVGGAILGIQGFPDTNCSPTFGANNDFRFYCGEIPQTFSPIQPLDPLSGTPAAPGTQTVVDPRAYSLDVETDFVHIGAAFEFNDNWRAVYQFGYSDSEVTAAGSNDRDAVYGSRFGPSPVMGVNVTAAGTNEYMSHELRVEFARGQWLAMVGVFTSDIEDFDLFDFAFAPYQDPDPFSISPTMGIDCPACLLVLPLTRAATDVTTNAIFARVGWESADERWRLGVEARFQDEEKKLDPATGDPMSPRFKDSWDAFTPRFTADYRLNENQLLYASLANGAKSGGFNNTVFDESQRSFEPDENWTFEIGSKNDLLGGNLRLNAAVYYTDWDDLQINSSPIGIPPGVTPPAIVDNTAGAEIWGIELDGTWFATEMLSFDYAVSYSNSEYKSGAKSARIGLTGSCDGIVCPVDGDISGNQLQRQPEFQISLGAALTGTIARDWEWYARGDVSHQTKQYMDELNLAWLPERTLVNLRFELRNGPWTASLWGKNVFDEEYGSSGFFIATPFGTSYVPLLALQRTYGLTVTFDLNL